MQEKWFKKLLFLNHEKKSRQEGKKSGTGERSGNP